MSYTFTKEKDSLTAIINLLGENPAGGTSDGTNVSYRDGQTPPTQEEIDAELKRMQDEYDAQEYARNREIEYPSLGDQMDMIYKDNKNSTTTHAAAIEAVKTKWPKDNSGPVE